MITVNCKDVMPIQHELSVHVADNIQAIPAMKHENFVLSTFEHDDHIDKVKVTKSIQEYLDSIGEGNNFKVVSDSNKIFIESKNGKKINKVTPPVRKLGTCCGL